MTATARPSLTSGSPSVPPPPPIILASPDVQATPKRKQITSNSSRDDASPTKPRSTSPYFRQQRRKRHANQTKSPPSTSRYFGQGDYKSRLALESCCSLGSFLETVTPPEVTTTTTITTNHDGAILSQQFGHCPIFSQRFDTLQTKQKTRACSATAPLSLSEMAQEALRHLCQYGCYPRAYAPAREWHRLRSNLLVANQPSPSSSSSPPPPAKEEEEKSVQGVLQGWTCRLVSSPSPIPIVSFHDAAHQETFYSVEDVLKRFSSTTQSKSVTRRRKMPATGACDKRKKVADMDNEQEGTVTITTTTTRPCAAKAEPPQGSMPLFQAMKQEEDGLGFSLPPLSSLKEANDTMPRNAPQQQQGHDATFLVQQGTNKNNDANATATMALDLSKHTLPPARQRSSSSFYSFLYRLDSGKTGDKEHPYKDVVGWQTTGKQKEESLQSPFGLLEELFVSDPWRLLLSTIFLNRTTRRQVDRVLHCFLLHYPNAVAVTASENDNDNNNDARMAAIVRPLGLAQKRSKTIRRFSKEYQELVASKRQQQVQQQSEPPQLPPEFDLTPDEIQSLHGCGPYALDAYRIFIRRQELPTVLHSQDVALSMFVEYRRAAAAAAARVARRL